MSRGIVRRCRRAVPVVALAALLPLLLPGPADAANAGAGVVLGSVKFTNPEGLPPAGPQCADTTFDLEQTVAHAFVLNTVITGYAGSVSLSGSGGGTCENATSGFGTLTVSAEGVVATTGSSLHCQELTGSYIRVLTELTTVLFGDCSVNNFALNRVTFIAEVNFLPDNPTTDPDEPIRTASFQGAFTVSPS